MSKKSPLSKERNKLIEDFKGWLAKLREDFTPEEADYSLYDIYDNTTLCVEDLPPSIINFNPWGDDDISVHDLLYLSDDCLFQMSSSIKNSYSEIIAYLNEAEERNRTLQNERGRLSNIRSENFNIGGTSDYIDKAILDDIQEVNTLIRTTHDIGVPLSMNAIIPFSCRSVVETLHKLIADTTSHLMDVAPKTDDAVRVMSNVSDIRQKARGILNKFERQMKPRFTDVHFGSGLCRDIYVWELDGKDLVCRATRDLTLFRMMKWAIGSDIYVRGSDGHSFSYLLTLSSEIKGEVYGSRNHVFIEPYEDLTIKSGEVICRYSVGHNGRFVQN